MTGTNGAMRMKSLVCANDVHPQIYAFCFGLDAFCIQYKSWIVKQKTMLQFTDSVVWIGETCILLIELEFAVG